MKVRQRETSAVGEELDKEALELQIEEIRSSFADEIFVTQFVHRALWSSQGGQTKVCFDQGHEEPAGVISFVANNAVQSFVQKNPEWFAEDIKTALYLRERPQSYFVNPAQTVLPGVREVWSWSFSDKKEKNSIRNQLLSVLESENAAVQEAMTAVFEELFMNASIDAPREAQKQGRPLLQGEQGRIVLARCDSRLSLSCEDHYGTLSTERFVSRMNEVYTQGAGQVINFEAGRGGAGLGCVMLFERSSTLVLGVVKGRKSIVSCVIPRKKSYREREQVRKSIHIVEIEGEI